MASDERNIVIVGGGIIGCTSAYFLTRHASYDPVKHHITILEATSIASGSSGKAGGLLALWAYPSSIVPLSYKLHAELAAKHDGAKRWGYRSIHCGSLSAKGRTQAIEKNGNGISAAGKDTWQGLPKTDLKATGELKGGGIPKDLDWFDGDCVTGYSEMGTPTTTAQVHPYQFTTSMADLAVEAGAKVIFGSVTGMDHSGKSVKSVIYTKKDTNEVHTLLATDIILSAGPWTGQIFPEAPISALRAHSVVIEANVSPYAVFSEISLPKDFGRKTVGDVKVRRHGKEVSPEMYARPDGTVYACGEGDTVIPLPTSSDLVQCDTERCQDIIDYCGSISTPMRTGKVLARQACYLPQVSTGGGPLIGETGVKGLLLAAGHTCWGIQNSAATGKLISEIVFEGKARSANIDTLDPRKVLS